MFDDPALVEHEDVVGTGNGREAVGHDDGDRSGTGGEIPRADQVALEDGLFAGRVQGCGRLVEHEQQRLGPHRRAGKCGALPLAFGEFNTVEPASELSVQPVG